MAKALPNVFDKTLRDTFDHLKLPRPLAKGAVRHVAGIARGTVLTTNFDRVLEAAFEDAGRPFLHVFPGSHIREASYGVQFFKRFLLKLHGDYFDSASRVLTLTEYTREYGSDDPEKVDMNLPLPRVLGQALGARPLLFLGCSLKNDRTTCVIAQIAKGLPGTMHFALLSESDETAARRQQLDAWNIYPLFFPKGDFRKIDQFLAVLATAVAIPAEGIAGRLLVIPGAQERTSIETMGALREAVQDPKRSVALTTGDVSQVIRDKPPGARAGPRRRAAASPTFVK